MEHRHLNTAVGWLGLLAGQCLAGIWAEVTGWAFGQRLLAGQCLQVLPGGAAGLSRLAPMSVLHCYKSFAFSKIMFHFQ